MDITYFKVYNLKTILETMIHAQNKIMLSNDQNKTMLKTIKYRLPTLITI